MESPLNTISLSKCWKNIEYFQENPLLGNLCEMREYQSFAMTLGERIQLQCGCSAGTPCYWSSEPSNCQKKTDFIEYFIQKPCVLRCFHVLPYRCFWHPNSPVYGPQKVSFEFYPFQKEGNLLSKVPFYVSPKFEVKNEMKMQEFELPRRVLIEEDIVVKVQFHGKHQAQTLQLPAWMQRTPDDLLPKYYVCISFVGALGLSYSFVRSQKASFW
jgi:hypothetical protein